MRVSALRSAGTYVAHLSRDRARRRCYIACARFVLQHWVLYVLQHFLDMKGNLYFVLATRKMSTIFQKNLCTKCFFLQGRVLWTERALLAILNIGVCHTKSQAERGMEDGGQ